MILGGTSLGLQGAQMGMNAFKSSPMQIPGAQSPNLGQTLMSQRPMPTANDIYPKQPQGTQPQTNGSILGNSLYNNPYMMNRRRY